MFGLYLVLNLGVLWFAARGSSTSGWSLVLRLFVLGWIVGSANSLVEAVFFNVLTLSQTLVPAIFAAIVFAILAPLAGFLSNLWNKRSPVSEIGDFTPLALLLVILAYEFLYWGAGTIVFPYIAHFYESRALPPAFEVAAVQVVRSLIFVAAAYPLLKGGLRGAPLRLALVYGIIGGLAPLLLDNPYMPADIRFYHAVETSVSNFIFGVVVGFLFDRRRRTRREPAAA